jgi:hypothetical protein
MESHTGGLGLSQTPFCLAWLNCYSFFIHKENSSVF